MELHEFRKRLRDVLQEPDDRGRFPDSTLDGYINGGILDVADRIECLVDTVKLPVAVDSTLLPDDLLRVKRVSIGNKRIRPTTALYLDREAQERGVNWMEQHGAPMHFIIEGTTIQLYPRPTDVVDVQLTYVRAPKPLVHDDDASPLPTWLNPLVLLYAAAEAWKSDEDVRWQGQKQEYEGELAIAKRRWDARQPQGRTRIRLGV